MEDIVIAQTAKAIMVVGEIGLRLFAMNAIARPFFRFSAGAKQPTLGRMTKMAVDASHPC
jgi:hypothetical protein